MNMEPVKEEEAGEMLDGWDYEIVLILCWLADPICERQEVLLLSLRIVMIDTNNDNNLHAV
jgi:hypothetical protein